MLKIKNLHAEIDNQKILQGVNLQVNPGETHVILGPNGSGKSTFGRVLLGDPKYKQTSGEITLNEQNANEMTPAERSQNGFFLSFQSPPELDGVTVKNFLFAAKKSTDPTAKSFFRFKKSLLAIMSQLGLKPEFIEREMNKNFSGGERKKMEIATMMILNPQIAFLDEIDSGVDIDAINKIASVIKEFKADKTKSVIIVSHTEKLLKEITPDFVHILCGGKIIKSGGADIIEKVHKQGFCDFLQCKIHSVN